MWKCSIFFFLNQLKKIKITKKNQKQSSQKTKKILPPKQKNPKIQNKKQNKQKKAQSLEQKN